MEFIAKTYAKINKKKKNIHTKLFNDSKKKQKKISDLEQKIYEEEEKVCTFSPKINIGEKKNKQSINDDLSGIFKVRVNGPPYGYTLVRTNNTINVDKNLDDNLNQKNINNGFMFIKEKLSKSNQNFYKGNNNRVKKAGESSFNRNKFSNYAFLLNDKDIVFYNLNNSYNHKNKIKNISNNDLFTIIDRNDNNSFFEENGLSKTSRNCYCIKKSKTNNKNNSTPCLYNYNNRINNYLDFNIIGNEQLSKNNLSNACSVLNTNINSNYIKDNNGNLFRTQTNRRKKMNEIIQSKYIKRNKNTEKELRNKSLNDIYNMKEYEIFNINKKRKGKNKNSLYKNNTNKYNGIEPIKIYSCRKRNNTCEKVLYEPIYRNNNNNMDSNTIIPNKNTLHTNNLYKGLSSQYINKTNRIQDFIINNRDGIQILRNCDDLNYIYTNNNEVNEIIQDNESQSYMKKNNPDKSSNYKNYYYTFRKGKIPYNSFNYYSSKKTKIKNTIPTDKTPMILKDDPIKTGSNPGFNRANSFYLKNFDKNVCRINNKIMSKIDNSNSINNNKKESFYDLTCKKESTAQFSGADYITNNDTKGCSISSFSLYPSKSPKNNQCFKLGGTSESNKCYNSIPINKNRTSFSKLNNASKMKIKKKNKQNIRQYINTFNGKNIDNLIPNNNRNGLNCFDSNEKNKKYKESQNDNLEIDYNVVNECYINTNNGSQRANKSGKCVNMGSNGKNDKSMTLQSLSDSKMLDLADHYINNGDDSLDIMDVKLIELRKTMKKERVNREITFG